MSDLCMQQSSGGWTALIGTLKMEVLNKPQEVSKLALPSVLYTIQNNLLYKALSNLDAATYSVCYQLKILTTALFSVLLLKRQLSPLKWFSLVLLTAGVALAELATRAKSAHSETAATAVAAAAGDNATRLGTKAADEAANAALHLGSDLLYNTASQSPVLGFVCVILAACTSGFAGVYFELILKGAKTSLWIRNVQMGLPSIAFAMASVYTVDAAKVQQNGFFYGYNSTVWSVILLQACGGLVVAVVVKYADNILKAFASAVSIITSCLLSAVLFGFRPQPPFIVGSALVSLAVFLYGKPEESAAHSSTVEQLPTVATLGGKTLSHRELAGDREAEVSLIDTARTRALSGY
jgi:solute carrier family 35 (UDP-sugar transporter), member A1/2/3